LFNIVKQDNMKAFKSIIEFQKVFGTEDVCREYLEQQKWNGTPACTCCGSTKVTRFAKDARRFQCNEKACRKQFSVLTGTFAENTKIPLVKWFLAMYLLANHSKGISSLQLSIWLDCTQKTAWFLNHRIREMLTDRSGDLLTGTIEIDETYVGGSDRNRHQNKKKGKGSKAMVVGAVKRKVTEEVDGKTVTTEPSKVKVKVIPSADIPSIQQFIKDNVKEGENMVTDESHAYNKVKDKYNHDTVNHRAKEYVRGIVHTNTIEGFWNILKKQIDGIHHSVSTKHLHRYCNESAYRYNSKEVAQDERFAVALSNCSGRLRYQDLIATI
jgi:transposase-like protein